MFKRTLALLALAVTTLTGFALEVKDLHLPMKRSEADNALTKDYTFAILSDATVRRTWHVGNRTVCVDFDPAEDSTICITIAYSKPVSRKTAEADALAIAPNATGKWKKTAKRAVEDVGIPAGSLVKKGAGKSLLFLEASRTKKKYSGLSYYAQAPHRNRRNLSPMEGERRTAMGSTSASSGLKSLISDEQARQSAPRRAVAATKPAATQQKPKNTQTPKPIAATDRKPKLPATTGSGKTPAASPSGDTEVVTTTRTITFVTEEDADEEEEEYENLWEMAKAKATPLNIAAAAGALIFLICLFFRAIARFRAKRRLKANFEQIISSSPVSATKVNVPKPTDKD